MRNRAKCKLCKTVIESQTTFDYVTCKCGEVAISGGLDKYRVFANDLANVIRVDDNDNDIVPKIETKKPQVDKPSKQDLLKLFEDMIKGLEDQPREVMWSPVCHYDLLSALLLISSILKATWEGDLDDCKEDI